MIRYFKSNKWLENKKVIAEKNFQACLETKKMLL